MKQAFLFCVIRDSGKIRLLLVKIAARCFPDIHESYQRIRKLLLQRRGDEHAE